MSASITNLKACFSILESEYRIEDARRESIVTRSGTFLQFSGVLAGIGVAQLIAESGKQNCSLIILAFYASSILLSVLSVVFFIVSMKSHNYLRFPNETIDINQIVAMTEIQYSTCLVQTIKEIVSYNQSQNNNRLIKYSIGIYICAASAFILFATIIWNIIKGIAI